MPTLLADIVLFLTMQLRPHANSCSSSATDLDPLDAAITRAQQNSSCLREYAAINHNNLRRRSASGNHPSACGLDIKAVEVQRDITTANLKSVP